MDLEKVIGFIFGRGRKEALERRATADTPVETHIPTIVNRGLGLSPEPTPAPYKPTIGPSRNQVLHEALVSPKNAESPVYTNPLHRGYIGKALAAPSPLPSAKPALKHKVSYKPGVVKSPDWDDRLDEAINVFEPEGLPLAAILSQMATESTRGTHKSTTSGNNYFGYQAYDENLKATRKFKSSLESMQAIVRLVKEDPRYKKAWEARNDPVKFIREMEAAGYAGDPKTYKERADNGYDRYSDLIMDTPEWRAYHTPTPTPLPSPIQGQIQKRMGQY